MADPLLAPGELSTLLDEDLDPDLESLLIELATGEVQAAAGQQLVRVADDEITVMGDTDSWLHLPERPVTTVTSVAVDGQPVTDWKRFGSRLWRARGWAHVTGQPYRGPHTPTEVTVVYTHGYETTDTALGAARRAAMVVAAQIHENLTGAVGYSIDDYREQYSQSPGSVVGGEVPQTVKASLRRTYGLRAGLVRLG